MKKWWIGYLLALFTLLWAKLPGPSTQEESEPSREFRIKRKSTARGGKLIEISTEAAELSWLPERVEGITIQRVKPQPDGGYIAEEAPLRSRVEVATTSSCTAELHSLRQEVMERLLGGTGHHAIVVGSVEEGRFNKQAEMIVEGKGKGIWRILRLK